ncbi:MAG TPA: penicillin-binding transpeptidase domain-containing protein [Phycisphaerae bacterium]|nr:penicillin-binding transpeptidase domain-containing protein [Phycisphaerae bacterium]HQL72371.1 penicillin-binding transpeptidase domain-containing protein [Phycisphaerae bacterium]
MYKRRLKIFMAIMALAFAVIFARLVQLQIIQGDEHRRQYERLLQKTELLPAVRGRILDRAGSILAMDLPCYDLCMDYRLIKGDLRWQRSQQRRIMREGKLEAQAALALLHQRVANAWQLARTAAQWTGTDLDKRVSKLVFRVEAIRQARIDRLGDVAGSEIREEFDSHAVVPALDEAMAVALQAQLDDTVGVAIRPSNRRHYPFAALACHIVGVTGQVNPAEQEMLNIDERHEDDPLERARRNYLGGDMIGKFGVERACESRLRGQRGIRRLERGGRDEQVDPALPGRDVRLTLDTALQKDLEAIFPAGSNGCIVVLSVPRGEVLGMLSLPTFDLNRYYADYELLAEDQKDLPTLHRAVGKRYPPGSTAKVVAATAALASGTFTTGTTVHCSGYLFPNVRDRFRCWIAKQYGSHGDLTCEEAIKHSCNVFFYTVGNRMGTRRMGDYFRLFGFGDPPGLGLRSEVAGNIPTDPHAGTARFMAIGQGALEATPLHVANMMASIARGGAFLPPRLVLDDSPDPAPRSLGLSSQQVQAIQRGMYKVVNERGGTAYKVFHAEGEEPEVEICGKTGTAQTAPQRIDSNQNDRIDLEDDIVYQGDTAWFAGFAPYRNPQIAFAVVIEYVEKGGSGGRTAGPVAKKVVAACKARGYIK